MSESVAPRTPLQIWIVEIFVLGNLSFLALDIYLAHSYNDFANPAEWIPFVFSLVAPFLLLPGILRGVHDRGFSLWAGLCVGGTSVLVGIAGMLFHLDSNFFDDQTLKALVYTAPFAAPLAYTGVGLLLILNRLEPPDSPAWCSWVVFLAMCGFVGNLALSLCDHAQNGFFVPAEWIPVVASALATSFLLVAVVREPEGRYLRICQQMMVFQVVVGVLGFYLHFTAETQQVTGSIVSKLIYGAPVFAPLLFANLGILAMTGLWNMQSTSAKSPSIVSDAVPSHRAAEPQVPSD